MNRGTLWGGSDRARHGKRSTVDGYRAEGDKLPLSRGLQFILEATMFFTRLGKLLAILSLTSGLCLITVGLLMGSEKLTLIEPGITRFFSWAKSPDAIIDKGFDFVFFSCMLGILAEIRYALQEDRGRF